MRTCLLDDKMRTIKEKLGDNINDNDEVATIEMKMQSTGMPPNIWEHAQKELRRLKKIQPQQQGYISLFAYLELLANLPWQKISEQYELDLTAVKEHLDRNHYGLFKVKQRIVEYVAVQKLKADIRSLVLCFVGPPGVGKTSLAASTAATLGRKFIHLSLNGVNDEAYIRGHRRPYSKSSRGCLINGIKRAGVCNPVMLLDQIDKFGFDVRGDPEGALLQALDPKQNIAFNDHYLNVPFDLSEVIFMATANEVELIPLSLLEMMKVIELPGYTLEEKLKIAMQHLIPKVLKQHGLSSEFLQIPEDIVKLVIRCYTREAGVTNLEQNLAKLAREAASRFAEQDHATSVCEDMHQLSSSILESRLAEGAEVETEVVPMDVDNPEISNTVRLNFSMVVDKDMLASVLGPPMSHNRETADHVVAIGLMLTAYGGDIQPVEATTVIGKGNLHLTGQLGDVMKESAMIALTWVRAMAPQMNLALDEKTNLMESRDIHIHFPVGAIPKDGPSVGVVLVTALVSLFSQRRVMADTAMMGEMTLSGVVLPVGDIMDKILAAHRYGIRRVILPVGNSKDLVEVPSDVLASFQIILVQQMEEILDEALEGGCP